MRASLYISQAIIAFFLLIVCSCGSSTREANEKHRQEQAVLRAKDSLALKIAVTPTLDALPVFVALQHGIFDSLDVDVSIKEMKSQMDCDEAFRQGKLEMMLSDVMRCERLRAQGYPLNYVSSTGAYWQMIGNRKNRIKEIKHLGDKMIAMTRYSATDYLATLAIDSVKPENPVFRIQVNDVNVRLMMLINNEMDAVMLPEPYATTARQSGHPVLFDSRNRDIQLGVIVMRSTSDPRRKDQLSKFITGYNAACDSINQKGIQHYGTLLQEHCHTEANIVKSLPHQRFNHVSLPREKDINRTHNVKWRTY